MRLIEEEQLDFDDVSIMPKRSSLNSRSEVDLWRTFRWTSCKGNTHELTCRPIISAIMTTVGTPQMAKNLVVRGYLASIEKHYGADEIMKLYEYLENLSLSEGRKDRYFYSDKISLSIGLNDSLDVLEEVKKHHKINIIHVDCPNAYIPNFKKRIVEVRNILPEAFMIAGVVVTSDLTTDLVNIGVNCVSMGICTGCFDGDMGVITERGVVPIKDICIGDMVLTHNNTYEEVTNKFEFSTHKNLIDISGIRCTPDHKFYVADIDDIPKITDENYKSYCFWVKAIDLDPKRHKLLKINPIQSK